MRGWALDRDNLTAGLPVHIYVDGRPVGGRQCRPTKGSRQSRDASPRKPWCCWTIPAKFLDGGNYRISVRTLDPQPRGETTLKSSGLSEWFGTQAPVGAIQAVLPVAVAVPLLFATVVPLALIATQPVAYHELPQHCGEAGLIRPLRGAIPPISSGSDDRTPRLSSFFLSFRLSLAGPASGMRIASDSGQRALVRAAGGRGEFCNVWRFCNERCSQRALRRRR